jgi:hypothetical protein
MPVATNRISLDPTQYVRVNQGQGRFKVQAIHGDCYLVLTDNKPATSNRVAHALRSGMVMDFEAHDTNVWVLPRENGSQVVVTEYLGGNSGNQFAYQTYYSAYADGVSVSTATPILTLWNPSGNTQLVELARMMLSADKKSTYRLWITTNAAAITGATFQPVNSHSGMYCDSPQMDASAVRATSYNHALMDLVTVVITQQPRMVDLTNPNPERIQFTIPPGTYLGLESTASTGIASGVLEWGEII